MKIWVIILKIIKSIFHSSDEKSPEDLKKEKLNQKFITFSTQLYDFISQTKNINLPKSRILNWVRDFDLLYRIDGISISRQQKALNWYFSHAYQEFVPIIESGGAFLKKFISLENAMNRASNSGKRTSYTPQKSIGIAHLPRNVLTNRFRMILQQMKMEISLH